MSLDQTRSTSSFCTRNGTGRTEESEYWGITSEYGVLRDVLLGPIESFGPMDNMAYSSLFRSTAMAGLDFDHNVAKTQYLEMCSAYQDADVTLHTLPSDPHLKYGLYARDSSFMTPWGAVITQLANPRRRGSTLLPSSSIWSVGYLFMTSFPRGILKGEIFTLSNRGRFDRLYKPALRRGFGQTNRRLGRT